MYIYPYYYYPYIPNYIYNHLRYPTLRVYPPVDTHQFSGSVKSFRLLMQQGSILLDKLSEAQFETKIMSAAQQGNQSEVDNLIKSIGLNVPVTTKYTPSGVDFNLQTQPGQNSPISCCSLIISMKWGN